MILLRNFLNMCLWDMYSMALCECKDTKNMHAKYIFNKN